MYNFKLGILSIAFGQKHNNLAINLAKSLIITNPSIKRAIVTDEAGSAVLKDYYDIIIPLQGDVESNLFHKLLLNKYSPFGETLFIDADCLVFKDLTATFKLLSIQSFSNVGQEISDGEWYMDVKTVLKEIGLKSIPQINGGIYFFRKDDIANNVFRLAVTIAQQYTEVGLKPFSDGGINEEPIYSIAMAKNKLTTVPDPNRIVMYTPLGISGTFHIDFITRGCSFIKNGILVDPSIIHFCGNISQKMHYQREVEKINYTLKKTPRNLIRLYCTLRYNVPYFIFVLSKRIAKKAIGRKNISFFPYLPIYSND